MQQGWQGVTAGWCTADPFCTCADLFVCTLFHTLQCPAVTNCAVGGMAANSCDGCLTCAAGFQLSGDKKSCTACNVAQCTGGYDTNTCNCKACASGYQGAACTACAATRPNCATMAANTCNGCATCSAGYSLDANGNCIQCSVANCGTYSTNTCTCTACNTGYSLASNTCTAVSDKSAAGRAQWFVSEA